MSDISEAPEVSNSNISAAETEQRSFSGVFLGLLGFAILAAIGGLIWSYVLSTRLTKAEAQLVQTQQLAQQQNDKLTTELQRVSARQTAAELLGQSMGISQRQLEARADSILRRQQADAQRLESEQAATKQQIGAVSTDVSSVKTDVGGVKTDVAQTKTELQNTQAQLQSMKGDLGIQSGLIATNHSELEILKHKGDRNYYEFTLRKGQKQAVSTVSLELRKADTKRSRYTLNVYADDKKIEKKDRGLNEPVQFYTGKDNYLYELVVNNISKDTLQGYISTPKGAPVPVSTGH
jgi:chromosome segregation ATPase